MSTLDDVIVVGAGPAGAVAATVLARAGARVRLLDRAIFPRDKLCGDTINPGALAALRRLDLAAPIESAGLAVDGMCVTGPTGVAIEGRYPEGMCGRALLRRDLDWALLRQAVAAGAAFEPAVAVRGPLEAGGPNRSIAGVVAGVNGRAREFRAAVTIAADGRRSTLAFALGLARHPTRPRRWAIGAYYENVPHRSSIGEMHIRRGRYVGVAPVPGGLTNVCVVRSFEKGVARNAPFKRLLTDELARDPWLRDRFAAARIVTPPVVLGPLAVDVSAAAVTGLLLTGDAAGFIDPMTGDGLRFAITGGALAADAALEALAHGWSAGVPGRLEARRRREFGAKWRFNRALRGLVAHPSLIHGAALAARVWPDVLRRIIRTAGDCDAATRHNTR